MGLSIRCVGNALRFLLAAAPRIDLIQLALLGRERINYERQIQFTAAQRSSVVLSKQEYLKASGATALPAELEAQLTGDSLRLPGNGELAYVLNGVHTALSVRYYLPTKEDTSGSQKGDAATTNQTVSAGIHTPVRLPYRKLMLRGEKAI